MNPFGLFGGEVYTLPTVQEPSWRNIEGGIGLFAGIAAGLMISPPIAIALAAGGAILGGAVGKARMQHEFKHGRNIHSPSFFNKTWIAGTLVGICCAAILVPLVLSGFPALAMAANVSLIAAGSLIGSVSEFLKQRSDFRRAREYHEIDRMKEVEHAMRKDTPSKERTLTPQQELPEFQDKPKMNNQEKRVQQRMTKPPEKQPDFRSQLNSTAPTGKGGIV